MMDRQTVRNGIMERVFCGLMVVAANTFASDWPQIGGPLWNRTSPDKDLADQWPTNGPPEVWKTSGLGGGFSSPIVCHGRVFVMGRQVEGALRGWNDQPVAPGPDVLTCLDQDSGVVLWKHDLGAMSDKAPSAWSTPAADEHCVYARCGNGEVRCVSARDGVLIWRWPQHAAGTASRNYAIAGGLAVIGNLLCFTQDESLHALDRKTGEQKWEHKFAEVQGWGHVARNILTLDVKNTKFILVSNEVLDPVDSRRVYTWAPNRGGISWWSAYAGDKLVSGFCDGVVCHQFDLTPAGAVTNRELWVWDGSDTEPGKKYGKSFGGPIIWGNYAYVWLGTDGRGLVCIELSTGRQMWMEKSKGQIGYGIPAAADNKIFLFNGGHLKMIAADPTGFREIATARVCDNTWSSLAIANRRIFVRDDSGTLKCLNLRRTR